MSDVCLIYILRDPRDNEVRYVGKTVRGLGARLRAHICRTNLTPKRHSSRWIAGLVQGGLLPLIEQIETVPADADWQERERFWIAEYRQQGARLTNLADGGEGVAGVRFTEERKRQQSERFKGRVFDDQWRERISSAKRGKPGKTPTAETIAKRSASTRATRAVKAAAKTHCANGHEWQAENLTASKQCKLCKADYFRRTYVSSPQNREERAAALDAIRDRPEVRAKQSAAAKRRASDPEYRRMLSERARRPSPMRGDKSPNRKLDWDRVAEIRRRCAAGEFRAALAAEFGVCPAVVDRIVWNQTWRIEHMPKAA